MKIVKITIVCFVACFLISGIPSLSGMLGISVGAATKIIDAIMTGMSIWSIIGLLLLSGGSAAVAFALAKTAIKRFGRKVAITW